MSQLWEDFEIAININSEEIHDTTDVYAPTVILDDSTYKMWYTGNGNSIIYCDSTNAKDWSNFEMVINNGAQGTYDTQHSSTPTVIKDGSIYKMWYTGTAGNRNRIIYCDSVDGENWANFEMVVDAGSEGTYDTQHASSPTVILDGSTYKMWYGGHDYWNYRIIYCTSSDGKNWSNYRMVVNTSTLNPNYTSWSYAPTVIKNGPTYKMWYTSRLENGARTRVAYCDSLDGIHWDNHQVVVNYGTQGYDSYYAESPTVVLNDNSYMMWYSGYNGYNWRIIYCNYNAPSVSGYLSNDARIIIINKSDWSIINSYEKSAGNYSIATTPGEKAVIAISSDGKIIGYGDVVPLV